MKKIGFIDYYISEWHANNYPAWIENEANANGLSYKVAYAWAEKDISPVDGRSTDKWCEDFGVTRCQSIDELCEKSDVIVILAPSDPDKHLAYVKEAFKFGKPTYVDKTFAPDLATAKEIFSLGEKYGTPFFSSSALRYTSALSDLPKLKMITTTGGGSNFPEYSVHQAEMVIAALKQSPTAVKVEKQGKQYCVSVKLTENCAATMLYSPPLGFTLTAEDGEGNVIHRQANDAFFNALIKDMIRFFETKTVSFDVNETLEVMKLREAAIKGTENLNTWINV